MEKNLDILEKTEELSLISCSDIHLIFNLDFLTVESPSNAVWCFV
jgi:hypothetical protein